VGKEEKADEGKGEVPNKKTKKTKNKLNKEIQQETMRRKIE
jgi:hypothetical protein